jgi:hypothetical protein
MALVTERIDTQDGGTVAVDVIYNNVGQQVVDHFHVSNGAAYPILLIVYVSGVEQWRRWFDPGQYDVSPVAEGLGAIEWRKATKATTWQLAVSS